MADPERAVHGDFHIIKMDGLFHVVFRPDIDPEWFRIIASFFTYQRAWCYCDIERVSVWSYKDSETGEVHAESETGDEELQGLRAAPIHIPVPEGWMATRDGAADLVRNVLTDSAPEDEDPPAPHPDEDFTDHPHEDEHPKEFHERTFREGVKATLARLADEADEEGEAEATPITAESPADLTDNQWSVLQFFQGHADAEGNVSATLKAIASESGVAQGSMPYFLETLERKGFIQVIDRGGPTRVGTFKLVPADKREDKSPRCVTCGGPRSVGSASQCNTCYRGELRVVAQ